MNEAFRLLPDGLDQLGVRMAEHEAHHARVAVVVLVAVDVDELRAPSTAEHDARRVAPAEDGLLVARGEIEVAVRECE